MQYRRYSFLLILLLGFVPFMTTSPAYAGDGSAINARSVHGGQGSIDPRVKATALDRKLLGLDSNAKPFLRSIANCPAGCIKGLDPKFASQLARLMKAAQSAGFRPKIISGYRSVAKQAQLYARYKSGRGGLAARPGHSRHNFGQAADIDDKSGRQQQFLRWMWKNSPGFGIINPPRIRSRDRHHFQLNGPGTPGFQPDNSIGADGQQGQTTRNPTRLRTVAV